MCVVVQTVDVVVVDVHRTIIKSTKTYPCLSSLFDNNSNKNIHT